MSQDHVKTIHNMPDTGFRNSAARDVRFIAFALSSLVLLVGCFLFVTWNAQRKPAREINYSEIKTAGDQYTVISKMMRREGDRYYFYLILVDAGGVQNIALVDEPVYNHTQYLHRAFAVKLQSGALQVTAIVE